MHAARASWVRTATRSRSERLNLASVATHTSVVLVRVGRGSRAAVPRFGHLTAGQIEDVSHRVHDGQGSDGGVTGRNGGRSDPSGLTRSGTAQLGDGGPGAGADTALVPPDRW